ncbi:MAG: hypothetical protein ACLRPV_01285 [Lacrimispora saccharolytica]
MDPQQELFSELLLKMKELGYDVYDTFLPPKGTPYPFIYLADSQQTDTPNKTAVFGNVSQTIHIWHNNPRQRGTVSKMLLDIKKICYKLEHTENFAWMVRDVNQRILSDNTTKTPLLHGLLEVEFKFS